MQERTKIIPHGEIIRRTRILAGLNKLDVAKAAGIPHSSVIRAERGQSVSPKTAVGISKALGLEFDEIFTIRTPGAAGAGTEPVTGRA